MCHFVYSFPFLHIRYFFCQFSTLFKRLACASDNRTRYAEHTFNSSNDTVYCVHGGPLARVSHFTDKTACNTIAAIGDIARIAAVVKHRLSARKSNDAAHIIGSSVHLSKVLSREDCTPGRFSHHAAYTVGFVGCYLPGVQ